MNTSRYLYTSGAFAKLTGVNKRTLHYYNDIGLFCPAVVGENGYHYYTCFQAAQLELILTLRNVGLSIEDIRSYMDGSPERSFAQILSEKKAYIDRSIEQLLEIKGFLQRKSDQWELGMKAEHGAVEEIYLPERQVLLSGAITGAYDEEDFAVASEFSLRLKKRFGLYDNFGSRISVENIERRAWNQYDAFFAYGREGACDERLPAGTHLRAFCIGGWDQLRGVYERILNYAADRGLRLTGYAYEEGLNEMSVRQREDYITMITVRCEEASAHVRE